MTFIEGYQKKPGSENAVTAAIAWPCGFMLEPSSLKSAHGEGGHTAYLRLDDGVRRNAILLDTVREVKLTDVIAAMENEMAQGTLLLTGEQLAAAVEKRVSA